MNKNNYFIVASILFFFAGLSFTFDSQSILGTTFISFSIINLILHFRIYKRKNILEEMSTSPNLELVGNDPLFNDEFKAGNKVAAVKRCKELTGCRLQDAYDYVADYDLE